ncbi:MAG: hypothetical protein ACJ786_24390 [Catenulispora sp.]
MSSQGFEGLGSLDDEVAAYAAEVRAELADLPAEEGAELLEDLEDHLREVAAEDAGVLRERLGAPAVYARELRQAAGLPAAGEARRTGRASAAAGRRALWSSARGRLSAAEQRVRATDAGREVLDFLPSLRPAWWVLRAWVLVRALELWGDHANAWHDYALIPKVQGSRTLGFLALLVAIPASVYLARREFPTGWQRQTVFAAKGALAVFAFAIVVTGLATEGDGSSGNLPQGQVAFAQPPESGLHDDGRSITNLWVYDKDGKRLDGVYVYDQDGRQVDVNLQGGASGQESYIDGDSWVDASGQLVTNRYPKQVLQPQWNDSANSMGYAAVPPPNVTVPQKVHRPADPTASPSGSATPSPSGSANPSGSPTASPSGSPTTNPSTPATPAGTPPPGATPAQGSSPSSTLPSPPATPGAKG